MGRIREIDRGKCRKIVEERFSPEVVVGEYEKLYFDLLKDVS